jgi:MraZ protein
MKPNNRLALPAGFHETILDGVYATQGFDRNLLVLPKNAFDRLYRSAADLNLADPLARLFLRMFFGSAAYLKIGRDKTLNLPENLVLFAGLAQAVQIVGQGEFFEIWAADQWDGQKEQLKDFEANARRFSEFRITTR